jgi:glycosyltransferase A (GT-A) superfamily protein (DUF2064 family)
MQTLIVFAREPIAGRTKTRLCPPLDGATAAGLYACFLRDVLDNMRQVPMSTPTVLADTLVLAHDLGLCVELLPVWYDVDTVAELHRLAAGLSAAPPDVAPHTRAFLQTLVVEGT